MNRPSRLNFKSKLVLSMITLGSVPLIVLSIMSLISVEKLNRAVEQSYRSVSDEVIEMIDRNLFERYGDVQAFGRNTAILNRESWYKAGETDNIVTKAMNNYVRLYGLYPLTMAVDLEGRVIAVNDRNAAGQPIPTSALYANNYKDASWFKAAVQGNFLKSELLDGTHVSDPWFDEDVARLTQGDGFVLGFTAPIFDAEGKMIGIWHNRADFSLVEEILSSAQAKLEHRGFTTADLRLLNPQGLILAEFDPHRTGSRTVQRDRKAILSVNLLQGSELTSEDLAGESGVKRFIPKGEMVEHVGGYAHSNGALGFPGLKWSIIVGVEAAESDRIARQTKMILLLITLASIAATIGVSMWLARSLSRPILAALETIQLGGEEITSASNEVSKSGQTLADGASRQAAALEETAAALEEMSGVTKRNAEHAVQAQSVAVQTRDTADNGAARMSAMQSAMNDIQVASQEITKILKTIDEISFQTNILALNAAVEAARAGEAGAGFAVVAEEVRALAQRSAAAAKETAGKIEDSVNKSQLGAKISAEVASNFTAIQAGIKQLDSLVADIATASREQSEGITQVNSAVSDMDKVTQQNAATAEENAASSEELNSQSIVLTHTVGNLFNLIGGRRQLDMLGQGGTPRPRGHLKKDRNAAAGSNQPVSPVLPNKESAEQNQSSHFVDA